MSLYHEAAGLLTAGSSSGSLKSRVFSNKELKSPPAQIYALALESCKWSAVLKEVIENAKLLEAERKLTPVLAVLLVHDFLVSKTGIALPTTHGLRAAVERHKARLSSEFTRARLWKKCSTVDALKSLVEDESRTGPVHPRWVRINTLATTLDDQLDKTFKGFEVVPSVRDVIEGPFSAKRICLDGHVPNLVAVSPGGFDFAKAEAYRTGAIILQDKASCFPAYLLDPRPEDEEDGDVIDACAAPGNKTTHLAAIMDERRGLRLSGKQQQQQQPGFKIHAFEKDKLRAKTLDRMVKLAGSDGFTVINAGQDFMKVDPHAAQYSKVGALLLDPSCSGSGIVGRDDAPELHLPAAAGTATASPGPPDNNKKKRTKKTTAAVTAQKKEQQKRKREGDDSKPQPVMVDDDGETTVLGSEKELQARIEALASFQLSLLLHAFSFPAARKITYSTCSVHAGENEHVVVKALASEVARQRGWKILGRERQVRGMQEWPVRGSVDACGGDDVLADACIRANRDDGNGVMGFFVAAFVREGAAAAEGRSDGDEGPYVRDAEGRIVRDEDGIPTLKATGEKAIDLYCQEEEEGYPSSLEDASRRAGSADDDDWGGFED
ncbi:S-adenosyl-L-methionine-dependent methyltransferase [Podospora didyma]|uniref:S-adenosyl-L-methionine-dependent methyltransferase n=1 Tax=Podospora didyma TaxID=330526 RepID=A0AAE0KEN5_9PEZI|nr:S-adenosyl-L-methionine-dependent methyltransferase [Podospora didyma]